MIKIKAVLHSSFFCKVSNGLNTGSGPPRLSAYDLSELKNATRECYKGVGRGSGGGQVQDTIHMESN